MLRTRFCDLLGIEAPIIQAPIWPAASPELAAAVCNAGGLGSIAAVFGNTERVTQHIARVRELSDRPFAVNHVVPFLNEEAFAATLKARPAVISLSLGKPDGLVARAHAVGIKVAHQVHNVEQGKQAADQGVDIIIAQGSEGGGQGMALGVGTMALVPQLVDAVSPIPVLAAGGIGDGRGLAAALVLGAQGVNIGTRFIASQEANAVEDWKQGVLNARSEDVIRFDVWQEIFPKTENAYLIAPRVLRSPFVDKWQGRPEAARQEAAHLKEEVLSVVREHRLDKLLPFAGQTAGMIRETLPAEEIVKRMVAEAAKALGNTARLLG